jgi:hypothetical protein
MAPTAFSERRGAGSSSFEGGNWKALHDLGGCKGLFYFHPQITFLGDAVRQPSSGASP